MRQSTDLIGGGAAAAQLEYRIVRPDADVRVIYGESELLLDDPGRAMKRIITFKDITEVRRSQDRERELERQLIHSQKLEALGTLAGGIAHDLNNTLVPVLALSQMLMENVTDEDREDLQTIILATHRAKELVQQILAFSRKQEVRKAKIDPAVVIRQALQMLRSTLPANIAVIEEIDDVPEILADAGQLQQVVVNLVTNAAHAIGAANGSIAVTAERHDDFVRIQIADTGCGMEKGVLDRMFEPFFTTKGVGEGTGLGLSVAHGLVTGHGGRIEASSEPGKGTTVTIELPMGEPPIDALKAAA